MSALAVQGEEGLGEQIGGPNYRRPHFDLEESLRELSLSSQEKMPAARSE